VQSDRPVAPVTILNKASTPAAFYACSVPFHIRLRFLSAGSIRGKVKIQADKTIRVRAAAHTPTMNTLKRQANDPEKILKVIQHL
jgi:hypothetical protein